MVFCRCCWSTSTPSFFFVVFVSLSFLFFSCPACWVSLLFSSEIIFSTWTTTAVVCLVFLFCYPQKLITLIVSCVSNVNQEILLGLVPRDSFDLRKKSSIALPMSVNIYPQIYFTFSVWRGILGSAFPVWRSRVFDSLCHSRDTASSMWSVWLLNSVQFFNHQRHGTNASFFYIWQGVLVK